MGLLYTPVFTRSVMQDLQDLAGDNAQAELAPLLGEARYRADIVLPDSSPDKKSLTRGDRSPVCSKNSSRAQSSMIRPASTKNHAMANPAGKTHLMGEYHHCHPVAYKHSHDIEIRFTSVQ